jgi:hypothetical protein
MSSKKLLCSDSPLGIGDGSHDLAYQRVIGAVGSPSPFEADSDKKDEYPTRCTGRRSFTSARLQHCFLSPFTALSDFHLLFRG